MFEHELSVYYVWEKRLLKYLQNNHIEYVFTIQLGESWDRRFWVIYDNQLYVLQYNEGRDELYSVDIENFINDNMDFFKEPINEN